MTPHAELAQLAAEMTVWRDHFGAAPNTDALDAEGFQGRADGYRAAALTLRRHTPCTAVRDALQGRADDMDQWVTHWTRHGDHGAAAWCAGYARALEDAAELVAEHVDGAP